MTLTPQSLPRADRPVYFPGQLLCADDLTASQDVDSGLRKLHHRMLHGWGIASGLVVTGVAGGISVTIAQGYAIDTDGTELVLPDSIVMPIPPVTGSANGTARQYTLVLTAIPDDQAPVVLRDSDCGARGAVRRSDAPALAWLDRAAVRGGIDVVLGEIFVLGCVLTGPPDGSLRRLLNPPPTPYAASGRTGAGTTAWTLVEPLGAGAWAVKTIVDSSEAGFGDTPAYLARIDGGHLLSIPGQAPAIIDGVPHVEDAEPGRFAVVVPLLPATISSTNGVLPVNPTSIVTGSDLITNVTTTLHWVVEWIGVES